MKKHGSDMVRKMMVVNLANCKKLLGDTTGATKVLDEEDWSAVDAKFQICVAAVRGDVASVVSLIRTVKDSALLSKADFREWPVFEGVKSQPDFIAEFEAVFGEPFVVTKEEVSAPKLVEEQLNSESQ
jgi:hypothetical protein